MLITERWLRDVGFRPLEGYTKTVQVRGELTFDSLEFYPTKRTSFPLRFKYPQGTAGPFVLTKQRMNKYRKLITTTLIVDEEGFRQYFDGKLDDDVIRAFAEAGYKILTDE